MGPVLSKQEQEDLIKVDVFLIWKCGLVPEEIYAFGGPTLCSLSANWYASYREAKRELIKCLERRIAHATSETRST